MTLVETRTSLEPLLAPRGFALHVPAEIAPRTLAEAVQAAVRGVDARLLPPATRPGAGLAECPQSLLALLAYSYARGRYGSREIEESLWQDKSLRELSRREIPRARTLRQFRRDHREAVCHCLKAALCFLSQRAGSGPMQNTSREEQLTEEANSRLMKAMFIDRMELEDDDF